VRRKVVNRVKFKSTQIRLAFKALFSVPPPSFTLSSRARAVAKLGINWNREKEPPMAGN